MGSTQQPDKPRCLLWKQKAYLAAGSAAKLHLRTSPRKKSVKGERLPMKLSLDTSRPAIVPLRDAMLCIDCEFVTPAANGNCSICSGHRLVILSELLELLVEQACGTKAPARLADLASILVGNNSLKRSSSRNRHQKEPSGFERLRHFEC